MRRIWSIPLSWLYALAVHIRHVLYDNRLLSSAAVGVPTICVGNLAVGGTGKTPHVEYLVRLLQSHGYCVAVLSRGYKRKTHGFVLADERSTALTIGDEAMQLHRKFPELAVAVCENRVYGVRMLTRKVVNLDVVILDDAMQHRALRSGLTIMLTAYDRLYIDDHMLPWGTLRDLPSRSLKADMVVVTKCPETIQPIDMRVVDNRLSLPTYQHLYFSTIQYGGMEAEGTPFIVCGIARPENLIAHVQSLRPHAETMIFGDHYAYTERDIDTILLRAKNYDFVLTTEKDAERLALTSLSARLAEQGKRLVVLPIAVRMLHDEAHFHRRILSYLREHTRRTSNS